MTDTTDQQAVTVAQEDREAATLYWQSQEIGSPETYAQIRAGRRDDSHLIRAFARHRLASVSSASAEGGHGVERVAQAIYEAGGSFADQNGPIAWSDLEGSNDAENFRKMACAALAAMPTQIVAQDLREILERIRDVPDNLLPSATIQRMRNIAGFGLIGERIS